MDLGKQGEQLFKKIMTERNYTVQDVSANPNYYDKDIDFIITSPTSGDTKTFEVKYDSRINKTGNLYLELTSINSKQWNGQGWWVHCKADYLVYGDAVSRQFYVIPLLELRKRVQKLPNRIAAFKNESTGLLVSLNDIKDITEIL